MAILTRCVKRSILTRVMAYKGGFSLYLKQLLAAVLAGLVTWVLLATLPLAFDIPSLVELLPFGIFLLVSLGIFALSLSITLYFITDHYVEKPLHQFVEQLDSAQEKGFLMRLPERPAGSVSQLAQSYNRLMSRITALDASSIETEMELHATQEELKLKSTLAEKKTHLETLYKTARALSLSLNARNPYGELLSTIGNNLGFQELVLMLYQEKAKTLNIVSTYGGEELKKCRGMIFSADEGLSGEAVKKKQPIYIPNTSDDDRYLYYKGKQPQDVCFLSIPLLSVDGDKVVGVLNASRPIEKPFTKLERETLEAISQQLAMAITNVQLFDHVKQLSIRDGLTGLHNRRHGQQTIMQESIRSQRFRKAFSIILIDIDHFKQFNDQHGHPQGDALLKEFARLLVRNLREVDYVARWGGEEFVILLPNTDLDGGLHVAEKICRLTEAAHFSKKANGSYQHVTISCGVANFPHHAAETHGLIVAADKALYQAKAGGRNQVVVASNPVSAQKTA
jgi:diguanylate cyclase (GGDEF)-like protein